MANPPRNRKRVRALRRAPDGSAFQNCDGCGSSVPVALIDMHECQGKQDVKKVVKKIKGKCDPPVVKQMSPSDEPRSAFQFFLESYTKTQNGEDLIEVNREAFDKWKQMSAKEQWPYIHQAEKVERAYMKAIREEVNQMSQEYDDEADSAMVRKCAQLYEDYDDDSEDSGDYNSYWSEEREDIRKWKRRRLW